MRRLRHLSHIGRQATHLRSNLVVPQEIMQMQTTFVSAYETDIKFWYCLVTIMNSFPYVVTVTLWSYIYIATMSLMACLEGKPTHCWARLPLLQVTLSGEGPHDGGGGMHEGCARWIYTMSVMRNQYNYCIVTSYVVAFACIHIHSKLLWYYRTAR